MKLPEAYSIVRNIQSERYSRMDRAEAIRKVFLAPYISVMGISKTEMAEVVRWLLEPVARFPGMPMKAGMARHMVREILSPEALNVRKVQAVDTVVLSGDLNWADKSDLVRVIRYAWNLNFTERGREELARK